MFLPFTYDEPNENSLPLIGPETNAIDPVAIEWRPEIFATPSQIEKEKSLRASPPIPWQTANIGEVRVQSRKAYEILHRIVPPDQTCAVRINPPKPVATPGPSPESGMILFHNGQLREAELAVRLNMHFPCSLILQSGDAGQWAMPSVGTVVFCYEATDGEEHLAEAVTRGSRILASDAGASEEYLARFARPGSWHCCHKWDWEMWREMIKDLAGEPSGVAQSSYVDQSPYIEATR